MWRVALATVSTILVVAASGCGMGESESGGDQHGDYGYGTAAELGELMQRPDAEEVLAKRDKMIAAVAAALSSVVPGSHWVPTGDESTSPCGEFGSTMGRSYTSKQYTSQVPIPPDLWTAASQAAIDAAAKYGYPDVQTRTENPREDEPMRLEVFSTEGHGGRLWLGSRRYANFYVRTGCYLTAKAKQDARNAAPPT